MRSLLLLSIAAAALAAACGDPFGLPAPIYSNAVDSLVSLYALTGTDVATPSAYRLEGSDNAVRVDQTTIFDFAFDIDTLGRAVLKPTGAIPIGVNSGVRTTNTAFDSIHIAPNRDYVLDSAIVVEVGTRVLVQSRLATCGWGGQAFYYAKLQVLAVDTIARRLDFQILTDQNCGYRGLDLGLPRR
jgi:hypothetical protein